MEAKLGVFSMHGILLSSACSWSRRRPLPHARHRLYAGSAIELIHGSKGLSSAYLPCMAYCRARPVHGLGRGAACLEGDLITGLHAAIAMLVLQEIVGLVGARRAHAWLPLFASPKVGGGPAFA
ncbi:hypothetical protein Dimus_020078 [Dionaea muscipula]